MDSREKEILRKISRRLNHVAKPPFKTGNLSSWSQWANSMQSAIASATDILESLIDTNPDEQQKQTEDDFLAKNLE